MREALELAAVEGLWLLVLSGLPASGKSTFRQEGEREGIRARVVCPDDLRPVVYGSEFDPGHEDILWRVTYTLLHHWLSRGVPVVFDATNISVKSRAPLIGIGRKYGARVWALHFQVSLETALERNRGRDRHVPEDIIRDMASRLEPPSTDEGFDEVMIVGERR